MWPDILPNDGDISNLFVNVPLNKEEGPAQHHDDACTDGLGSTSVSVVTRGQTELQTIHSILDPPSSHTVSWPPTGGTPVNLLSINLPLLDIFHVHFLHFFLWAAEFLVPRHHSITIRNYFKHLMLYQP